MSVTSSDRIKAAIELEFADRVPLGPLLDHFAATYTGITNAELMSNGKKRIAAILKTAEELGPWDMTFAGDTANATFLKAGVAAKIHIPGQELPDNEIHQFIEAEVLTPEDYDVMINDGFLRFASNIRRRLYPELNGFKALRMTVSALLEFKRHRKMIEATGAQMAVGAYLRMPTEIFSLGRSMQAFAMDLFDCPDKIKAAAKKFREYFTPKAIRAARFVGVPRLFIGLARSSPSMLSPKHMEEFIWPNLEYIVNTVADAGMTVMLHCDTDWSRGFDMFKRLPPKSCILELDGDTDMFKAKEALGDRMCIMGDVPAYLLAFGAKDEVLAYCKRLIKEVGKGGGFILSSGCSIPANAKPENVKAMKEAVEEWGYY